MRLKLVEFTEQYAKEICDWKYDNKYSIYNYPAWKKALDEKWAITIDVKRKKEFFAVVDDYYNLCGYVRAQEKSEFVLAGIGLRPSLCGHGIGFNVMELLVQKCRELYKNKKIVLEVRSFNKRAIKCYKKIGFEIKKTYKKETPMGSGEFIRMEYGYIN
ncbi:GNAT family N-acetyltransferase [uncultured Clostridium sp.]|uniref:GNAT family N-acetyltransferase n=1 Tax=uncultured Clostridium sp. TaxID=59620 RepID=UPI002601D17A|nr:GNAT family N-acetyltransferase [uncultured Clostridium sp.]